MKLMTPTIGAFTIVDGIKFTFDYSPWAKERAVRYRVTCAEQERSFQQPPPSNVRPRWVAEGGLAYDVHQNSGIGWEYAGDWQGSRRYSNRLRAMRAAIERKRQEIEAMRAKVAAYDAARQTHYEEFAAKEDSRAS